MPETKTIIDYQPHIEVVAGTNLTINQRACREVLGQSDTIAKLLAESITVRNLLTGNGFSKTRKVKFELFNYGGINVIGKLQVVPDFSELPVEKGTIGLDSPLAIGVISLKHAYPETGKDYVALSLIAQRCEQLGLTNWPTVRPLDLIEAKGQRLVIMLNEVVGAKRPNKSNWGSAEVNLQLYKDPDAKIQPVLVFNPYSSLNSDRFSTFWEERRRQLRLQKFDRETWKKMKQMSDSLAAGYVSALAQVWFLTGRVPYNFHINAGDGVYDGAAVSPKEDFKAVVPLKLITIRCGLSPVFTDSFTDFIAYIANLRSSSMFFNQKDDYKLAAHEGSRFCCFSRENFWSGLETAFTKMFNRQGKKIVKDLEENKTLTETWQRLGLKWEI